jgi:hypothetical protein
MQIKKKIGYIFEFFWRDIGFRSFFIRCILSGLKKRSGTSPFPDNIHQAEAAHRFWSTSQATRTFFNYRHTIIPP